ncbi:hypothetical protein Tco_0958497 [Tanacetum coccineum]
MIARGAPNLEKRDLRNLQTTRASLVGSAFAFASTHAGRIQLIAFMLSAMQQYWASVYMLPSTVLNDLEKLFKRFLWNSVMEDHLEKRNPLWAKWVNKVKLKGKSIWDLDYNSSDTWYDAREIYDVRINNNDCLADVIHDGRWRWPNEWNNMFPELRQINVPILSNRYDAVKWVDVHNHIKCNPTQAFILWIDIQGKLLTQDRMNGMSSKGRLIGRGYWLDNVIRTIEVSHIEGLYITDYNEINLLWFSYEKGGLLLVNEGSSTVLHIRGKNSSKEYWFYYRSVMH